MQSFRIQQHSKNICEHLTNLTRWNKRDSEAAQSHFLSDVLVVVAVVVA